MSKDIELKQSPISCKSPSSGSSMDSCSHRRHSSDGRRRRRGSCHSLTEARFSYTDLPCMDVKFVNDKDEVTRL